jgi:hypothetical protein
LVVSTNDVGREIAGPPNQFRLGIAEASEQTRDRHLELKWCEGQQIIKALRKNLLAADRSGTDGWPSKWRPGKSQQSYQGNQEQPETMVTMINMRTETTGLRLPTSPAPATGRATQADNGLERSREDTMRCDGGRAL